MTVEWKSGKFWMMSRAPRNKKQRASFFTQGSLCSLFVNCHIESEENIFLEDEEQKPQYPSLTIEAVL